MATPVETASSAKAFYEKNYFPSPLKSEEWDVIVEKSRLWPSTDPFKFAEAYAKSKKWELILERERSKVAEGVKVIKDAVIHRDWLTEGRGPYEWNDDNWHAEFAAASKEILTALEPLEKIAADLSDCPTKWEDVLAAHEDLEFKVSHLQEELRVSRLEYTNACSAYTKDSKRLHMVLGDLTTELAAANDQRLLTEIKNTCCDGQCAVPDLILAAQVCETHKHEGRRPCEFCRTQLGLPEAK
jgi:hypothetical protein